jgi:hypothetical protein
MAMLGGLGLTLLTQFTPARGLLGSAPIALRDWGVVAACAVAPFLAIELQKSLSTRTTTTVVRPQLPILAEA